MKKLKIFVLIALFIFVTATPVSAAKNYVIDETKSLAAEEIAALQTQCEELYNAYGCDVVLLIVDSLGYKTATEYADDYFDYNGYDEGILFLLSLEYRDWAISTTGKAISIFTDSKIDSMFASMRGDLAQDRYYDAFETFLNLCDIHMAAYNGTGDIPVTYPEYEQEIRAEKLKNSLVTGCIAGAIAAIIATVIFVRQMKSVAPKKQAAQYAEGMRITRRADLFLYSRTTRRRKPENNSSGGSGTHRGSSGRSHGGRSGKF